MSDGVETVLFENADWTVTSAGLEHKANGYFIEREHLDMRRSDGLWNWPLQMLEKTWCMPYSFTEAFGAAVLAYGIVREGAAASFVAALQSRLDSGTVAILRRRAGVRSLRGSDHAVAGEPAWTAGRQPRLGPLFPLRESAGIPI